MHSRPHKKISGAGADAPQISKGKDGQLYVGSGRGAEKKAYVVQFLQEKGFTIDPDSLDKLIEAAVFNLPEYIGLIEAEGEEND